MDKQTKADMQILVHFILSALFTSQVVNVKIMSYSVSCVLLLDAV